MENQFGYIRVSSAAQNLARQQAVMDKIGVPSDNTFVDKASAKDTDRPGLQQILTILRRGDTLHVASMDRLCRSLVDLQQTVQTLTHKDVTVKFHKENLTFSADTDDPFANFQLQLLGAVGELERNLIAERRREGQQAARDRGVQFGRPRVLTPEQLETIKQRKDAGESATDLAREFEVSRSTLYDSLRKAG